MKKIISVIVTLVLLAVSGNAFADQNVRWSHHGGYQPNQNYGYNNDDYDNQHSDYYGNHRHGGSNIGDIILGTVAIVGAEVVLGIIRSQQPPAYQQPLVRCAQAQQQMTDRQGRPLYDYTGQPLVRWVQVCPSVVR